MRWRNNKWITLPLLFVSVSIILWFCCYFVLQELQYKNDWVQWGIPTGIAGVMVLSRIGKKREYQGIEHGSARWGSKKDIKPYIHKDFSQNIILSKTERLSIDTRKTQRNLHVMVGGGSGSGKSRGYVKPNVMQMNASYVITDPSGEHLRSEGQMLQDDGYKLKVFNVWDMLSSMHFNPFHYFTKEKDVRSFVNILMANTTGDTTNPQSNEDFWVKAERLWFMSHIAYMMEELPPQEVNINTLLAMLNEADAREDDEEHLDPIDILFKELEQKNPRSFAAKQYRKYKKAAGKTAKSILISIGVRMADFDIPEVSELFQNDELELDKLGTEKTALFLIMDETDDTFSYMIAILIDVLINQLKKTACSSPNGELPVLVRLILDEIMNIGRFPKLSLWTRTLRKYNIGFEFLIQDIAGAKDIYKEQWKSIEGNCDTTIFLGGKEQDTKKFVAEDLLGKTTIESVEYGGNGNSGTIGIGSYSQNQRNQERYLLDNAEIGKLKNNECIIAIRGLPPFKSKKYDLKKHPNYHLLADGKTAGFSYTRNRLDPDRFMYITEINLNTIQSETKGEIT